MRVCVYVCTIHFGMLITIKEFLLFIVIFNFVHYAEGFGALCGRVC
jgi:hypothetical protein